MAPADSATSADVTRTPDPHLVNQQDGSRTAGRDYAGLVRAAASGDREAMEALLMHAQEVAWRFSTHVCGRTDEAEDVMQEALIKTYRHASSIRHPEAFRTWLYRTVRNVCLMRRRTRVDEPKRMLSLDELVPTREGPPRRIDAVDPGRGPETLAMDARLREELKRAIAQLPTPYRVVLFLREMEGLSTREVAAVIGTSEDNVKQRLHRARLFLRKELDHP
jgi:RNA polymerase sigma-70 factor, ECF subfamily